MGHKKRKRGTKGSTSFQSCQIYLAFFTGTVAAESADPTLVALTAGNVAQEAPPITDDSPVNPSGSGAASSDPQTDGEDDAQVTVSDSTSPSPSLPSDSETHIVDDPALWPKLLTDGELCSIVKMGPVQVKDKDFPQNEKGRRFTKANYYILMKNGERVNSSWLLYSESADRVFCFCCRLFGKQKQQLSEEGFNDWKNLAMHLINHERSEEHRKHSDSWQQLSHRLETKQSSESGHN